MTAACGNCLAPFEEALEAGWLTPEEMEAIRGRVGGSPPGAGTIRWLRREILQLLGRHAVDEPSRALAVWGAKAISSLEASDASSRPTRVFFAPGGDCHDAVIAGLEAAQTCLDICVFTITDDRVTSSIREAARRGLRVRIITDDQKAFDPGSDVHYLAAAGLPVRQDFGDEHMHHKFAVIDGAQVITGSFNWTRGSSFNHENILISADPSVVAAYAQEFERLWETMPPLRNE